jgi:hypothetical protein
MSSVIYSVETKDSRVDGCSLRKNFTAHILLELRNKVALGAHVRQQLYYREQLTYLCPAPASPTRPRPRSAEIAVGALAVSVCVLFPAVTAIHQCILYERVTLRTETSTHPDVSDGENVTLCACQSHPRRGVAARSSPTPRLISAALRGRGQVCPDRRLI